MVGKLFRVGLQVKCFYFCRGCVMTRQRMLRMSLVVGLAVVLAPVVFGCGANNGLPAELTVELPDGTTQVVTLGAGVASLADSSWQFFEDSGTGQSIPFLVMAFGPGGTLDRFEDNTIATEIFGTTLIFDGERHDTTQPGLTYAAATFGAETNDSTGFAFVGQLTGFAAGFPVAEATAIASGTFDPNDPDILRGTFSFTSVISIAAIPDGDVDISFDFIAHRIVE